MILKEYQKRTLETVEIFLQRLTEWRGKQAKALEVDADIAFDWVGRAWDKTVPARPYLARRNGLGKWLPSFCLKIPTGGGKTLLATKIIDLVNVLYRRQPRGLVLWIVPTTQIYNQTLKALKDRGHPYRQQVDLASGGRTLVLEKTSGFGPLLSGRRQRGRLPGASEADTDLCSEHAQKVDWAEFVPAMNGIGMHYEIVDEDEWQQRLNAMLI